MSVDNINVVKKTFNLDLAKLTKEQADIIRSVLPEETCEIISFEIHDVDVSVANGIRRAVISEIETKGLHYVWSDIDTDQRHIIAWELHDRIRYIPLNQDCPNDITFAVDVINRGEEDLIVWSSDIVSSDGKSYFPGNIRIAELEPMHHLKIPHIAVDTARNFISTHGADMMTASYKYRPTDYVGVDYMCEKSIVNRMVLTADLEKLLKKYNIKENGKRPLIIYNKMYEHFHSDIPDVYNFVESPEDYIDENEFLRWYQSAEANPQHFALSFETLGNIPSKRMINEALEQLAERVDKVKSDFLHCIENGLDSYQSVYIMQEGDVVMIGVDESKTVERLFTRHIYKLDETIPFIASKSEYTVNVGFEIIMIHPDYAKLFVDAGDLIADTLRGIAGEFKK